MADDIEVALYSYLQTKPALTALVGTRVFKNRIPEGAARPHVVYQRIAAQRERVLAGALGACSAYYQFDVYADSASSLNAVRKQLRLALDGYSGTSEGVSIQAAWLSDDWDSYDPDVKLYRAMMEFEVTFLETTN